MEENGLFFEKIADAKHAGETMKSQGCAVRVRRVIHPDHGPGWGLYQME